MYNSKPIPNGGEGEGVKHYMDQLVEGFFWKMAISIVGSAISYVQGFYGDLMWGFLLLFSLDFITGIIKSKHKGIPISSRRLRNSVTKLASYMVLITALIVTSKYETSFAPVVTIMYYYMMFTELRSIFENVQETGVKLPAFLKEKIELKVKEYDSGVDPLQGIKTKEEDKDESEGQS